MLEHEVGIELRAMQLGAAVHAGGVQPGAGGRRARVMFQDVMTVVMPLVVREAGVGKTDGGQVRQLVARVEHDQRAAIGADQISRCAQDVMPGRVGVGQVVHGLHCAGEDNLMLEHGVSPTWPSARAEIMPANLRSLRNIHA
ncbi:hypothetical protein D3C72_1792630 [compost metagenome]